MTNKQHISPKQSERFRQVMEILTLDVVSTGCANIALVACRAKHSNRIANMICYVDPAPLENGQSAVYPLAELYDNKRAIEQFEPILDE